MKEDCFPDKGNSSDIETFIPTYLHKYQTNFKITSKWHCGGRLLASSSMIIWHWGVIDNKTVCQHSRTSDKEWGDFRAV